MPFPPLCFDCDKQIGFDRYQLGVCVECEKERDMDELLQTIQARKNGTATPQDQVEAAAKALKRYERNQHRPGQMLLLALAVGLVAGACAVATMRMLDEYLTTQHEIQTGSLLP